MSTQTGSYLLRAKVGQHRPCFSGLIDLFRNVSDDYEEITIGAKGLTTSVNELAQPPPANSNDGLSPHKLRKSMTGLTVPHGGDFLAAASRLSAWFAFQSITGILQRALHLRAQHLKYSVAF
ncbi:hypothetical protein [uncultured Ruegeria sp.]|uniref:hypothetical protein n=1 Tax=uncultured Ruegeria sp. TaxID=259304 RepID=UPI00260F9E95|nr:hypothetical protein [uncultured Ruegeria sp.]